GVVVPNPHATQLRVLIRAVLVDGAPTPALTGIAAEARRAVLHEVGVQDDEVTVEAADGASVARDVPLEAAVDDDGLTAPERVDRTARDVLGREGRLVVDEEGVDDGEAPAVPVDGAPSHRGVVS